MSKSEAKLFGSKKLRIFIIVTILILSCYLLPETLIIPVKGATTSDWNHATFWYEPWGTSGVHKGIDIFAQQGQAVISSTYGIRVYKGKLGIGGNVVIILGPKWRIHYYAHLKDGSISNRALIRTGEKFAEVGNSGNAAGKPPHLHYSIATLVPYPWRWDQTTQGWKKMFILNPSEILIND